MKIYGIEESVLFNSIDECTKKINSSDKVSFDFYYYKGIKDMLKEIITVGITIDIGGIR